MSETEARGVLPDGTELAIEPVSIRVIGDAEKLTIFLGNAVLEFSKGELNSLKGVRTGKSHVAKRAFPGKSTHVSPREIRQRLVVEMLAMSTMLIKTEQHSPLAMASAIATIVPEVFDAQ